MNEQLPSEEKVVYSIRLRASFYVIATNVTEAEKIANDLFPLKNIEIELPASAEPYYTAEFINNQSADSKRRAVNYDE